LFGYRRSKTITDPAAVASSIFSRLSDLESRSLKRIDQLVELAQGNTCNAQQLASHFGDSISQPCGRCTACLDPSTTPSIEIEASGKLGSSILSQLQSLRNQFPNELGSVRQTAKFLCGISAPQTIRKRLTKNDYFGCCTHLPFEFVYSQLG
jgi:ATP-dependent DNA helicase RecQ